MFESFDDLLEFRTGTTATAFFQWLYKIKGTAWFGLSHHLAAKLKRVLINSTSRREQVEQLS